MIIGAFYLTEQVEGAAGEGRVFRRLDQLERALELDEVALHATIEFRSDKTLLTPANGEAATYLKTTAGRVLFNATLPDDFPWINEPVTKREMGNIVDSLARDYPKAVVARSLDNLKDLCFHWAMRSGVTVSVDDVKTPAEKRAILDAHEKEAEKVESQFRRGIITDGERRQKEVEIWTSATERGEAAHGGRAQGRGLQPHRHDGRLRSAREHDAGPSDRGHARPGGQPSR